MLIEKAEILPSPGSEQAFHDVIRERGVPLLASIPGVRWVKFGRGVEAPNKFLFLVEWESLDAHGKFNSHPSHEEFLSLFRPYGEGGSMEHFEVE